MTSVPPTQPPAAPETDVRQWSIESEDGTRAFTSEDVALRVAAGDHGYTFGPDRDPIVASFTRANPGDEWTPITTGSLLDALTAARERVRVVEGERDELRQANDWNDWACRKNQDLYAETLARAESAEAAHAALVAAVEALCDPANDGPRPYAVPIGGDVLLAVDVDHLRAILTGGAR